MLTPNVMPMLNPLIANETRPVGWTPQSIPPAIVKTMVVPNELSRRLDSWEDRKG